MQSVGKSYRPVFVMRISGIINETKEIGNRSLEYRTNTCAGSKTCGTMATGRKHNAKYRSRPLDANFFVVQRREGIAHRRSPPKPSICLKIPKGRIMASPARALQS